MSASIAGWSGERLGGQAPTLSFGVQNPGHPWWNVAATVAEALVGFREPLLPQVRMSLTTPPALQGALYNPIEVGEGTLMLGITTPSVSARMASEGKGPFTRAYPGLRAIAAYPHIDYVVFVVDQDTGLTTLDELRERRYPLRMVTGRRSGDGVDDVLTFAVGEVLRQHGCDYDEIERWGGEVFFAGPTHVGGYLMLEGKAQALFQEAHVSRVFGEIAESRPTSVLPVGEHALDYMGHTFGFARAEVPAGHHSGARVATPTLDFSGWLLFCRDDLPDEWAYAIARACDETRAKIDADTYVSAWLDTPIDPVYLFNETAIPLHDGARAYAVEKGYVSASAGE